MRIIDKVDKVHQADNINQKEIVRIINEGERIIALIRGDIDHHSAAEIRAQIDSVLAMARPKLLIMDFSDVYFMDSSGIGLILGRMKEMRYYQGVVTVKSPKPHIRKIIDLAGISKMLAD